MFSSRLKEQATRSMEDGVGNLAKEELPILDTTNPSEGEFEDPFVAYEHAMEDAFQAQALQDTVTTYGCVPKPLADYLNADGSLEKFMPTTYSHVGQENLNDSAIVAITNEINDIIGVEADTNFGSDKKSFREKAAVFANRTKESFKKFFKKLGERKNILINWGKSVHPYYKIGTLVALGLAASAAGVYAYKKRKARVVSEKNLMEMISSLSNTKKAIEEISKVKNGEDVGSDIEKALGHVEAFSLQVEKEKAKIVKGSLPKPESKQLDQLGYGDSSFKDAAEAYKKAITEYTSAIDIAQKTNEKIASDMESAENNDELAALKFKEYAVATVIKRADDVNTFLKSQIERLGRKYTSKNDSSEE